MTYRSLEVTCSIQYSKGKPRDWNIQGGAHCRTRTKSEVQHVGQKKIIGHKNSSNSHNYRDEIELYQGISKRNTLWHSTPEERTPRNQCNRVWWGATRPMHNVSWYLYTYYDIDNPEIYNWNIHLKPNTRRTHTQKPVQQSMVGCYQTNAQCLMVPIYILWYR